MDILQDYTNFVNMRGLTNLYFYRVRDFLKYCDSKNLDFKKLTYREFTEFILYCREERKNQNGTLNNVLKALRKFYAWCGDNKIVEETVVNDIIKIKFFKVEQKIRDFLTERELRDVMYKVIKYSRHRSSNAKIRAIFLFLFFTGLRLREFLKLKREDIDLENKKVYVRVPVKNSCEVLSYFTDEVKNALKEYFISEPEGRNAFNCSKKVLANLFKKANGYLKDKHITTHTFRHSFTMMLSENEVDITVAQKLLNQKSIESTRIYYKPYLKLIERIYRDKIDKDNPKDRHHTEIS